MRPIRSVAGVIVGYMLFAISAVLLFQLSGRPPHEAAPLSFKALATLYGVVFAALGGWLAGWIAGRAPLAHAIALTGLIATGAVVSLLTAGDPDTWSQWSALVFMAPAALIGGALRARAGEAASRGGT